ncbi:prolyl oligopeptidase family serine peptidase [Angustibacter sp. McL0619]|uniref:prolyl oligopeptidase family serine peptidase n=1 Tax=Angustibacter sp. McL0619 TaxID=3415676 RepID=UPI003CF78FDE
MPLDHHFDREPADLRARLAREQEHADALLAPLDELVEQLARRLRSARARTTASLPYRLGEHWYVRRRVPGRPYPQICRRPAASWQPPACPDGWQVVLDGSSLAAATGYADVAEVTPSPDGALVAFTVDTTGDESYDLVVRDVAAGVEVDRVRQVASRFAWWPDGSGLAYATTDATLRPDTVRVHRLGSPVEQDVVAVHEPDPSRWVGVGASTSGRLLLVLSGSADSTEWLRLQGPPGRPLATVLVPRERHVQHQVEHARLAGHDVLLVLRSEPGRPDLLQLRRGLAPDAPTSTILAGHDRLQLLHLSASAAAVVLNVREDGLPCARVYRVDGVDGVAGGPDGAPPDVTAVFRHPLAEFASALAARPLDWAQPHVRVNRMSWGAPPQLLDLDVATAAQSVARHAPAPAGYEPERLRVERLRVERLRVERLRVERLRVPSSLDGVAIPLTVIGQPDDPRPGPLLLTVYGAYGQCQEPVFDLARAELLDRGMRVAIAHVRGGGDLGPRWHDAGRGRAKQTTFADLLDCARFLVEDGWTTPAGLVAQGTSAGGLAVAVAVNQQPELFAAVVALVPFVDPLTSMSEPSRPLTSLEHAEWGDPLSDTAVLQAMQAYSPRQNVRPVSYPPMYVTTAEQDWRADPAHVLDWVERLRSLGSGRGPILLRGLATGGHSGPTDPDELVREQALRLAWILNTAGLSGRSRAARAGTRPTPAG